MSTSTSLLQQLPSVDQVLQRETIRSLTQTYSRAVVRHTIQEHFDELRVQIRGGELSEEEVSRRLGRLDATVSARLEQRLCPSLRTVINATGVIIHTNVGRAPMARAAAEVMVELAASYSNLEYNLERGGRGQRDLHFEKRMTRLLGCEAATVCNNNAASVFLILNTLAEGRKVLVSRGELIEIGGSFRMPEIMQRSGAILQEIGTTNKTKISDYRQAIDEKTALILRVHPSNYKIIGFTQRPELEELIELARQRQVPLLEDLGSGYLFPTSHPFLREEPTVESTLAAGVDLVCFSGDKLLGGPQAGMIVGRKKLVDRVRKNPLMRACRMDKVTYAALEWTLIEYEKGTYPKSLPVYQMLSASPAEIRERALRLQQSPDSGVLRCELKEGYSLIGGGSAPEEHIATCLLAIRSSQHSVNELELRLRESPLPILTRIEGNQLILDLRTVFPEQDQVISSALARLASG